MLLSGEDLHFKEKVVVFVVSGGVLVYCKELQCGGCMSLS